jgi:hypothetical protein
MNKDQNLIAEAYTKVQEASLSYDREGNAHDSLDAFHKANVDKEQPKKNESTPESFADKYRLLETGEIVRKGDQVGQIVGSDRVWYNVGPATIDQPCPSSHWIRRKIEG